ncbi:MAG: LPS assembly lipoprotein LptE [Gammaproteobacteria bacterium]|nr:LPS assembly lipoprotein LptE [Gammaproteobacteria bacterium]MDE0364679.1 LPS assembly lipoprotein LptE [Gammaproteobacteria bacterium]
MLVIRATGFVLPALLAIAGCGFELRGWDLESSIESVHVTAQPRVRLAGELRRALGQAGVRIEPRASRAEMTVELLDERRGRRTVAVTGSARAAEYEVSITVRFAVRSGARVLREPVWLDASRVFVVDRDNIAGTAGEQALIEAELANDLVGQIMRALNAAAASAAPAGSAGAG